MGRSHRHGLESNTCSLRGTTTPEDKSRELKRKLSQEAGVEETTQNDLTGSTQRSVGRIGGSVRLMAAVALLPGAPWRSGLARRGGNRSGCVDGWRNGAVILHQLVWQGFLAGDIVRKTPRVCKPWVLLETHSS